MHLHGFGAALTTLSKEQADCFGVKFEEPYTGDTYRYTFPDGFLEAHQLEKTHTVTELIK